MQPSISRQPWPVPSLSGLHDQAATGEAGAPDNVMTRYRSRCAICSAFHEHESLGANVCLDCRRHASGGVVAGRAHGRTPSQSDVQVGYTPAEIERLTPRSPK